MHSHEFSTIRPYCTASSPLAVHSIPCVFRDPVVSYQQENLSPPGSCRLVTPHTSMRWGHKAVRNEQYHLQPLGRLVRRPRIASLAITTSRCCLLPCSVCGVVGTGCKKRLPVSRLPPLAGLNFSPRFSSPPLPFPPLSSSNCLPSFSIHQHKDERRSQHPHLLFASSQTWWPSILPRQVHCR